MEAGKSTSVAIAPGSTFIGRHQFLIYRLFSLAGLMPVGAYLVVHLATNASVLGGPATFQAQVDRIHSLGILLPLVEWTFIFIPILYHALVGWWIISGFLPNVSSYPYGSNIRYFFQRVTGMIAFFFILFHLWQLHYLGKLAGGGAFDAEHAASSTAIALGPVYWKIVYVIGTLAVVYHFSNGLWTFGITWGIWTSDRAQRGAGYVCAAFGVLLAFVGMGALYGMSTVNVPQAETIENRMEQTREMSEGKIAAHAAGPTQSNNQPPEKQN